MGAWRVPRCRGRIALALGGAGVARGGGRRRSALSRFVMALTLSPARRVCGVASAHPWRRSQRSGRALRLSCAWDVLSCARTSSAFPCKQLGRQIHGRQTHSRDAPHGGRALAPSPCVTSVNTVGVTPGLALSSRRFVSALRRAPASPAGLPDCQTASRGCCDSGRRLLTPLRSRRDPVAVSPHSRTLPRRSLVRATPNPARTLSSFRQRHGGACCVALPGNRDSRRIPSGDVVRRWWRMGVALCFHVAVGARMEPSTRAAFPLSTLRRSVWSVQFLALVYPLRRVGARRFGGAVWKTDLPPGAP